MPDENGQSRANSPMTIEEMIALLRDRTPEPGETGVQRISLAFGQVALSHPVDADQDALRRAAEQAVCAKYEEDIAKLTTELDRVRAVCAEYGAAADTAEKERDEAIKARNYYRDMLNRTDRGIDGD